MVFGQLERASGPAVGGDELPVAAVLDAERRQAEHALVAVADAPLPVHPRPRQDLHETEPAAAAAHADGLDVDVPPGVLEEQLLLAELPARRGHPVEARDLARAGAWSPRS
jgi:hypothetical protein